MKRTVKTIGRQEYIIEEYINFGELIKTNDSRTCNFSNGDGGRSKGDNSWCGASYEDAVNMLRYGWHDKEKVKVITDKIAKLEKMQDVQKMSFKNDIVGYAPVVPLALMGVPQNMINTTRKPKTKKAKVINLIIDIGFVASVSVEQKLDWGAEMVAKIMGLEKQGFRVRIDCVKVTSQDNWTDKVHVLKVPLKSENQPFDIKRMMFPIAHPAMQRRITFDWYERLPGAQRFSGYGRSIYNHSESHKKEVIKNIADTENSYFICCLDNIDEILKGVA